RKIIALMYQTWADLDHALGGLPTETAVARHEGSSSIAWTTGHVTNQVDAWLNVRFQGLPPHPLIGQPSFRAGGTGAAEDWPGILAGLREVQAAARSFLDTVPDADLDRAIPYNGSIAYLRPVGLSLRHAVMRIAAHHFLHVGEIQTIRAQLGLAVEDVPDWGVSFV
ncbi:MAG: DinB family protein, partial [Dehalococcoidia bacterium]